jgi:hypothetical protein
MANAPFKSLLFYMDVVKGTSFFFNERRTALNAAVLLLSTAYELIGIFASIQSRILKTLCQKTSWAVHAMSSIS